MDVDTANRVIQWRNFDFHYSEKDFVNPQAYDFHLRNWETREPVAHVIHDNGTVLAIVFPEYYAYTEQDALDEAVDNGKLDSLLIPYAELSDYETGKDSEGNPEYDGVAFLGNASEPFNQAYLGMFSLPAKLFARDPLIAKIIAENPEETDEPTKSTSEVEQ
jgi:hypothetical protein